MNTLIKWIITVCLFMAATIIFNKQFDKYQGLFEKYMLKAIEVIND